MLLLPRPVRVYCEQDKSSKASVAVGVCNRTGVTGSLEVRLDFGDGYQVSLGPVDLGALGEGNCTTMVAGLPDELVSRLCNRAVYEHYNYRRATVESIPCFNLDKLQVLFEGRECLFLCENTLGGHCIYQFSGLCPADTDCVFEAHVCGYYGQCGLAFARTYRPETDSVVNITVGKSLSPYLALVVCYSGFQFMVYSGPYVAFPYPLGRRAVDIVWASVLVDGVQVARYALPLEVYGLRFARLCEVSGGGRIPKPFAFQV